MWCVAVWSVVSMDKEITGSYVGEVIGTGIIGGMLSYPIAAVLMGNQTAALFTFVVPFLNQYRRWHDNGDGHYDDDAENGCY